MSKAMSVFGDICTYCGMTVFVILALVSGLTILWTLVL